jgi:methylaspartate mutase epsilon subunit
VGRGGRFIDTTGGGVTYRPSGREPVIVAGSRSGLPIPARGRNQKAPSSSHRALFLTPQALTRARTARLSATGSDRLDFAVDVLPLLLHEVEHVYYVTHVRIARGESQSEKFAAAHTAALRSGADPGPLLAAWGLGGVPPLDLDALARPFADERFGGPEEFTSRLLGVMDRDLAAAALGNSDGPLKAALDVLRDIRNVVRQAVDYGGLLPDSFTEDFQRRFLPVNSLLSAGPPASRVAQLRALVEQGVVTVAGPGTSFDTDEDSGLFRVSSAQVAGSERLVRVLVDARIPTPDLLRDSSPLTRQLAAEGMVRTYADEGPGGMDVTRAPFHVVDAKGRAQEGLYALGIPTEHTRWFTQVGSSRPGVDTLFYRDADAIAGDMLRTPVAVGSVVEQDATVQLRSVA